MTVPLRITLVIGAVLVLLFVARSIRGKRIQLEDSLFWVILSLLLVVAAIFPRIVYFFSQLLGFQSPSNFVFLAAIGILLVKEFINSLEISKLKHRLNRLAQQMALDASRDESRRP